MRSAVDSIPGLREELIGMTAEERIEHLAELLLYHAAEDESFFVEWCELRAGFSRYEIITLDCLARSARKLVQHETLVRRHEARRDGYDVEELRYCIRRIRRKIERAGLPIWISVEYGIGYRLEAPPDLIMPHQPGFDPAQWKRPLAAAA